MVGAAAEPSEGPGVGAARVRAPHMVDGDRAPEVVAELLIDLLILSRLCDARQPVAVRRPAP